MRDISNVWELSDEVSNLVDTFIFDRMKKVKAEDMGLDSRAGYSLYVNDDCIAVRKYNDRSLQYYGGFEYVESEHRQEIGDMVFYMVDSGRVADCIDCLNEVEGV